MLVALILYIPQPVTAQIKKCVNTGLEGIVYKFAQTREKDSPLNI